MVSLSCHEVVFCKSDVRFSSAIFLTRVGSLVDNWWLEAVPVERACDLVGRCKFCFLLCYLWFYLRCHRWARINLKFGYRYILHYEPSTTNKWKIKQRNNTLWYNPAFSKKVSTNIGHRFLVLVEKHLPEEIFNRNVIKISDNCMNSTKQIIYIYICIKYLSVTYQFFITFLDRRGVKSSNFYFFPFGRFRIM